MSFVRPLRITLYAILWIFSAVLLGLSAARLHYTLHLSPFDPLNQGTSFYDPIVAELVVTTLLTMIWAPFIVHNIVTKREYGHLYTFTSELVGLFVLFIFWLVGAAIATSFWGNLHWCHQYMQCRLLTALVAFAWLGWILIFALFLTSLLHSFANSAFSDPMHGQLYPRESVVYPAGTQTSEYRTSRA
ncbi:hypothetical protein DENSPDRAFT_812369 [Dentipellis sp. KUC8613]|nr:hypothetical protein DENSPDRAFT_812369 [Dentipellis sp. KUC8613]